MKILILFLLPLFLPTLAFADLEMIDQRGGVDGSGTHFSDWHIAVKPGTEYVWIRLMTPPLGSMGQWIENPLYQSQNITSISVTADRPIVDVSPKPEHVTWYKVYTNFLTADTVTFHYEVSWDGEVDFSGFGVEWASNDYTGTPWCECVSPEVNCSYRDLARAQCVADANDPAMVCDDHRFISVFAAWAHENVNPPDDACRWKCNAMAELTRGMGIPCGQVVTANTAHAFGFAGISLGFTGDGFHGVNTVWDDDEMGWFFVDPQYSASGVSPGCVYLGHAIRFEWREPSAYIVPSAAYVDSMWSTYPSSSVTMVPYAWSTSRRSASCHSTGIHQTQATMLFDGMGKCPDDPPICVDVPLGESNSGFRIAPNPTAGITRFLMPTPSRVEVFDASGRRVFANEGTDIEWNPPGSGVYFARFSDGRSEVTRKIIALK